MSVCLSVCLSVCVCHRKTPTSGGQKNFWSKGVLLIWARNDTISCFSMSMIIHVFQVFRVFGTSLLWASLLWMMGELAEGGSVAVGDTRHVTPQLFLWLAATNDVVAAIFLKSLEATNNLVSSHLLLPLRIYLPDTNIGGNYQQPYKRVPWLPRVCEKFDNNLTLYKKNTERI